MNQKIGFVGIGRMGANMARNLKDKGYEISSVNDVNKDAAAELSKELGCEHAETLAQVTASSDIIFIKGTEKELEATVTDLLGKQLLSEFITDKIDISCLEKGTYIINLTDGINTSSHKVIKN